MTLPILRTVNVTVSRTSAPASRRGFGVPLFLTSETVAGVLDATNLTSVYGSLQEVEADFAATTDFYQFASVVFSQSPAPIQIKAGWYDSAAVTDAVTAQDAISTLQDRDNAWYWLTVEPTLRDSDMASGLIAWTEAQSKYFVLDSNDILLEDAADTTNIAAVNKNTVERTAVAYHTDTTEYLSAGVVGFGATRNFDEAGSAYTLKFKNFNSISSVDLNSSAVQAITGFTPQLGQSVAAGHNANTYVDIGGVNFLVEGSSLTSNVFIDEIHFSDYIQARTEEEVLNALIQNDVIPMTDAGMQIIASAVRGVMERARNAGLIAEDVNPETGEFQESVIITVPSIQDVAASQRQARISPAIQVCFRYAGAVHYTTINYKVQF